MGWPPTVTTRPVTEFSCANRLAQASSRLTVRAIIFLIQKLLVIFPLYKFNHIYMDFVMRSRETIMRRSGVRSSGKGMKLILVKGSVFAGGANE